MWLFRSGEDGLPIAMTPSKPSEAAKLTYNEDDYDCAGAPIALTFEYGLVNDFLSDWCEMKAKLNNGDIEYSRAVTPQVRQTGNRLSGLAGTAYASLLT